VEYVARLPVGEGDARLVAVSFPRDEPIHPYPAIGRDYDLWLFVVTGKEIQKIAGHPFLKPTAPEDDVWETIGCGQLKVLLLKKDSPFPVVLAQNCWHEGESLYQYAIFNIGHLTDPQVGTAVWSYSDNPEAPHQVFVPNDDPEIPPGISPLRLDGETVTTEIQGRSLPKAGDGTEEFEYRRVRTIWRDDKLRHEYGTWGRAQRE